MHCDYCFYCDEQAKRAQQNYGFMSEDTLRNVIRKTLIQATGTANIAFQGGEPTLRGLAFFQKLMDYENQYNFNHVRIQNALQTNGRLIDEDWCRFLHDNHFLVGLSIDGLPDIHDKYRHLLGSNDSAFDCAGRAADLMDQFDVEYNILTVVHKDVADNIEDIYRSYQKRGWMYQQYIACLEPLGEERGKSAYALTPAAYGDFLIRLFELWYNDQKKGTAPYIRRFENYVGILLGYPPESCDQNGICGVQHVVEADGSVFPCDFYMLDDYRLGNFNTDRMNVIAAKRAEIGFVERSRRLDPACSSCEYYWLCRGGCQRNREWDPKTAIFHNYFCESYKSFFSACLSKMMDLIRNNQNYQ